MPKAKPKPNMTMLKLMDSFDTQERCRECLVALRWPEGPKCPRCGSDKLSRIYKRGQFDCDSCGYQFSVMAGTIFHDSHLPLTRWFVAVFLMCESKKGMSANQMKRTLGVSYKTAWYLCHRIRAAMKDADTTPLSGTVEADETWVGGRRRHVGRGYRKDKQMVLAAIQRGGGVRFKVDQTPDRKTLHLFLKEVTAPNTKEIFTDEWQAYKGIADEDTRHESVNHKAEEWVRGEVHTNTVEGVFSLLKRSIVGAYHQISKKHLDSYLDELEWRFNNRKNPYLFRDTMLRLLTAPTMPYKELVEKAAAGA